MSGLLHKAEDALHHHKHQDTGKSAEQRAHEHEHGAGSSVHLSWMTILLTCLRQQ